MEWDTPSLWPVDILAVFSVFTLAVVFGLLDGCVQSLATIIIWDTSVDVSHRPASSIRRHDSVVL